MRSGIGADNTSGWRGAARTEFFSNTGGWILMVLRGDLKWRGDLRGWDGAGFGMSLDCCVDLGDSDREIADSPDGCDGVGRSCIIGRGTL